MDYTALFLILVLTTTTTQATSLHHHCNSDVYSPASGMDDLQQLTTLQHCLIDNYVIDFCISKWLHRCSAYHLQRTTYYLWKVDDAIQCCLALPLC